MPLTAKQKAARARCVGASEAGALVGDYLHPYASPASIYARIELGIERSVGPAAHLGSRIEPWILDQARRELGVRVRTTSWTYSHPVLPLVATADAVTLDEPDAVVEAKYVTRFGEDAWTAGPPPWVVDQVQVQMALSRRRLAILAVFFGGSGKFARYDLEADPARQRAILGAVSAFNELHLEPKAPPAIVSPRDMGLSLQFASLDAGEVEARGELLDALEVLDAHARARIDAERREGLARSLVEALMAQAGATVALPPYGWPTAWRATVVDRQGTRSLRFLPSRSKESTGG